MNPTNSFAEAARRAFDDLSPEFQRSTDDDNCVEELEEFLQIMDNNDADEGEFYKDLEFEHERRPLLCLSLVASFSVACLPSSCSTFIKSFHSTKRVKLFNLQTQSLPTSSLTSTGMARMVDQMAVDTLGTHSVTRPEIVRRGSPIRSFE